MKRRIDWLTDRERVVLTHLMHGLSAEQIAATEYVSLTTVRAQIRSILAKLGVKSQVAAVAHAYGHLWDTPDDRRHAVTNLLLTPV